MNQIIGTLLAFIFPIICFGQDFKGSLKDLNTGEGVPMANIYISEIQSGTISNDSGVFILKNIPNKILEIQISHINYKTKIVEVDFSQETEKVFYLEPSHLNLQEVIVSVPKGKLQKENVLFIERTHIKTLNQTAPLNLSEAIAAIPGVETTTTGTGIGKPVIRGLSGNRIVTYAQGIRIENQQWGDEHGLGIGAVGIESVEVIKGPASLLYGSDALGGVLYFVDERYAKQNYIEGFVGTRFHSNTLGTDNNFGVKLSKNKLKWNIFGSYISNLDYQVPNGQRIYNTRFDEKNIKTSLGYSNKNWVSKFGYSFLNNTFGITEEDSIYSNSIERRNVLPFQTISNHNISWENTLFPKNSKLSLIVGYTGNRRKEFEKTSDTAALDMNLQTYTYNFKWYAPTIKNKLDIIIGTQGMYQNNSNKGEELLIPNALTADMGAFTVLNLSLNKIHLLSGIRWDYRYINSKEHIEDATPLFPSFSTNFHSLNYSLGGVYSVKRIAVRMNLSSGFRAPNTSELLSNGVHEGTNQYVLGNLALKSENATQIDFSFDYTSKHLNFSINPFFNQVKNYIFLSPSNDTIDSTPVYEYLQTEAMLYGGELGFHYHPHKIHWLHLESNLSTVFAQDKNGQALPLIPATRLNSTVQVNFSQKGKFQITEIFVNYIYKFDQNRVGIFETNSTNYHLLNSGASFKILTKNRPIELIIGARNILNTKYIDHLSRLKPMNVSNQGINFYIGIKVSFERELKAKEKSL